MNVDDFLPIFTKTPFRDESSSFIVNKDGIFLDDNDDFTFLLEEKMAMEDFDTITYEDWLPRECEKKDKNKELLCNLHKKTEIVRKRLSFQDIWSQMHFDYSFQWDPCKKVKCHICRKKAPILLVLCPFCNDVKCTECSFENPKCGRCNYQNYPNPPNYYRKLVFYDQLGWTFFTEISDFKKRFKKFCQLTLGENYISLLKQWNLLIEDLNDLLKSIK